MPNSRNFDYNFFGAWPKNKDGSFISKTAPTTPISTPPNRSRNNSPPNTNPSSPISTSPPPMMSPLRRTYSSTFTLIPEDREIDIISTEKSNGNNPFNTNRITIRRSNLNQSHSHPHNQQQTQSIKNGFKTNLDKNTLKMRVARVLLWWPLLLLKILFWITGNFFGFVFLPLSFAAPSFWFTALLWVFWKLIRFPVALFGYLIGTVVQEQEGNRNQRKRTVLISCGSTIQTLHLARNFYSSGARVIVFEFEGLFGLARFSTAVNKFYTVPRPTPDSPQDYIAAICEIVEKEKPTYYVPVCATSPAYYDALAKPHLELLGCASFIPGLQENCILDDTYELIKKCKDLDISVPQYKVISNKEELFSLYNTGWLTGFRNLMVATGLQGLLERYKYVLPNNSRDLKISQEISDENQWIVIRNMPGNHYITCTTVKDSKVIANVSCLVDPDTKSLMPEKNEKIEIWLNEFFTKLRLQRPINGHISFRFVKCDTTNQLLPLGSRVGVSLPYICYTGVHSRVLWKPCPHFNRQNSGPMVQDNGRYLISEAVMNTLKNPSVDAVNKLIGTVLDKREALFAFWDPLPYCAYYHFQLPLNSVKTFVQKRQAAAAKNRSIALTAPVH
ncbi:uncharacterized protein LOC129610719 [Condylostylus longicornis]|uniref:uncharacterized protein LOC129610719 n=1 Tax=Condylostylus longicornis TaxID=2530218 RepID=UPI00244DC6AB|nr:uncharacterized protein LOC129610719 [Condylostylus longicornis]